MDHSCSHSRRSQGANAKLFSHVLLMMLATNIASAGEVASTVESEGLFGKGEKAAIETFDIPKSGDFIVLPVRVGGRVVQFAIGTHSSRTVCDEQLKDTFGPETEVVEAGSSGGKAKYQFYEPPSMWVGAIPLNGKPIVCGDLELVRERTGHPIMGILGIDVLSQLVLQVDFAAGSLKVSRIYERDWERDPIPALILPGKDSMPCLLMAIGAEQSGYVKFDTMYSGAVTLDMQSMMRAIGKKDVRITGQTVAPPTLSAHPVSSRCGLLESLRTSVGKHGCPKVESLPVVEGSSNRVGLQFLSRLIVTFDFPKDKIYFAPGKDWDRRDYPDQSGMMLVKRGGAIVVDRVELDSPADRAGISVGDQVVSEADKEPLTLFEVRRLFCVDGKNVNLQILRDGRRYSRTLRLPAIPAESDK